MSADTGAPDEDTVEELADIDMVVADFRRTLALIPPERRNRIVHGLEQVRAEQVLEVVNWFALLEGPRTAQALDAMIRLRRSLERTAPELWPQVAGWAEHLAAAQEEPANAAWRHQIGPALSQADTARLLDKSPQAVHKDRRLLMLRQPGTGRPVYPIFQFHERRPLHGLAPVLAVLRDALLPESIASWLTGPHPELDGHRPFEALRDAPQDESVLELARRLAAAAA